MSNRFLVAGGDGNWNNTNNWAALTGAASGASFPVAGDVVAFDSNSGNAPMTVNVASACASLVMSGTYAGTLTFTSTLTTTSTVTFVSACTIAGTAGTLILGSGSTTLTSGGKTLTCALTFNALATWTLADDWIVTGLVSSATNSPTINGVGRKITCNGGLHQAATTITGTAKLVLGGGTWDNTGSTNVAVDLDLAGNVTVSGTVTFGSSSKTLTYVSGIITVTSSTLAVSAPSTLATAGMTWNNVTFGTAATYTLSSNLAWSGTVTISNSATFAGAGALNGAGALSFNNSTITLATNWTIGGLVSMTSASGTATLNGFQITCAGGLTQASGSSVVSGTTTLVLTGGTWSSSSSGALSKSVSLAGNVTISGTVVYSGTLTYTSGTITTTGSTLSVSSGSTLNTTGVTWNNVSMAGSPTSYTLSSALAGSGTLTLGASGTTTITGAGAMNWTGPVSVANNLATATITLNNTGGLTTTGTMTHNNAAITWAGSAGWTVGTLTTATYTASRTVTLTFGNTYTVTTAISNVGTTAAIRQALVSGTPGSKVVFNVTAGATEALTYCDPTDIDSSGGAQVTSINGTITTSLNWVGSVTTTAGGPGPVIGCNFIRGSGAGAA